jgi:hypothetical protein
MRLSTFCGLHRDTEQLYTYILNAYFLLYVLWRTFLFEERDTLTQKGPAV